MAIIGSRGIVRHDHDEILQYLPDNTDTIISGGAVGVDTIAAHFARAQGFELIEILPDYATHGRRAPTIRNREIVRMADFVLAIWDFVSRGTAHTIACCIEEQVPVRILGVKKPRENKKYASILSGKD